MDHSEATQEVPQEEQATGSERELPSTVDVKRKRMWDPGTVALALGEWQKNPYVISLLE